MSSSSAGHASVPEFEDDFSAVQSIFNSTRCYELIPNSAKIVVFETAVPFQLAFNALIEHGVRPPLFLIDLCYFLCFVSETDVAALRESSNRSLVAMMTPQDFIVALQICRQHSIPVSELSTKSIANMLASPILRFRHTEFHSIDPEDSAHQLYSMLQRTNTEYAPIVDPDTGHLVAVLGYYSMLYLLHEACKQHSKYFFQTIDHIGVFDNFVTAPTSTRLEIVLVALEQRNLLAIPVTDASGKVVGLYYRGDANFATRSHDPTMALQNLADMSVGDALQLQQRTLDSLTSLPTPPTPTGGPPAAPAPDPIPLPREYPTVKCALKDNVMKVVGLMMQSRTLIVVVVDENGLCLGTVTVMDILKYYFSNGVSNIRMDH